MLTRKLHVTFTLDLDKISDVFSEPRSSPLGLLYKYRKPMKTLRHIFCMQRFYFNSSFLRVHTITLDCNCSMKENVEMTVTKIDLFYAVKM